MRKSVGLLIAVGAVAVGLLPAAAAAQSLPPAAAAGDCKPLERATGRANPIRRFALNNAVANWRRAVILKYGDLYSIYGNARGKVEDCGRTQRYLAKCQVSAEPCSSGTSLPGGAGAVADAQRLLNRLGQRPRLKEDGVLGRQTRNALLNFQARARLPRTGEADEATLRELRRQAGTA